jgi:hypothetical protein
MTIPPLESGERVEGVPIAPLRPHSLPGNGVEHEVRQPGLPTTFRVRQGDKTETVGQPNVAVALLAHGRLDTSPAGL